MFYENVKKYLDSYPFLLNDSNFEASFIHTSTQILFTNIFL